MLVKLLRRLPVKWLFLLIMVFLVSGIFLEYFPEKKIEEIISDAGYSGSVIIILFIALSEIIAPVPGSPAVLASLAIFGWNKTLIYSFVGLIIAVVILKMFGNKYLEQIDLFTNKQGKTALLIGRTIGYPFSDFISYASGLTNIKFSTYFVISLLGISFSHLIFMSIFRHLNFDATQDFIYWVLVVGILATTFGALLHKYFKD